jgi:hypothetical protein
MATSDPVRQQLVSEIATLSHYHPGDPRLDELRAELATERLAAVVAKTLNSVPPLSAVQRARIVRVLYTGLARSDG